jgi:hypothetical protein
MLNRDDLSECLASVCVQGVCDGCARRSRGGSAGGSARRVGRPVMRGSLELSALMQEHASVGFCAPGTCATPLQVSRWTHVTRTNSDLSR